MGTFSVIIPAGGSSSRYGNTNKLLETLNKRTVIEETVSKFVDINEVERVIIPANASIIDRIQQYFKNPKILIIEGGKTRQESVYNGLKLVNTDYVIVHDAARPLVTVDIIKSVIDTVQVYNAVSVMTKTTDTIKEVDNNGFIVKTIDRSRLYNTQTPQAFKTQLLLKAHNKFINSSFTDDASMLEELNIPVYVLNGSYTNIKITTKSDLDFAKLYI